jgi:uncharacterized protein
MMRKCSSSGELNARLRQKVVGLEVKAAATLKANDTAGLRALAAGVGKKWIRGIVLYTGLEVIPFANNLHGVPLQALWQPIGG